MGSPSLKKNQPLLRDRMLETLWSFKPQTHRNCPQTSRHPLSTGSVRARWQWGLEETLLLSLFHQLRTLNPAVGSNSLTRAFHQKISSKGDAS